MELSAKFTKILGMLGPHPRSVPDGLFRQSFNGTGNGNGNLININGFLDIMFKEPSPNPRSLLAHQSLGPRAGL